LALEPATGIRTQIVAAAEHVIQDLGLRAATTRAIAERAGCAEGSIYTYFPDKQALLVEVIRRRYPEFVVLMQDLPGRVGAGTVRRNLEEVAAAALRFYREIFPVICGSMAEPKLLAQQRRYFEETKHGPMRSLGLLTDYVRREQRRGRISGRPSPEHVSRLLLGACWSQIQLEQLCGQEARLGSDERFARELVRSLTEGLAPAAT
jgi:AcrR family transcriptional regulator